jgi:hypothetical protein
MAEIGQHVDVIGNDWVSRRQLIICRYILSNSGIEVVASVNDELADQTLLATNQLKQEFYNPENGGLIMAETHPEDWLIMLSVNLVGDYINATPLHGPNCPLGDVGDSLPM